MTFDGKSASPNFAFRCAGGASRELEQQLVLRDGEVEARVEAALLTLNGKGVRAAAGHLVLLQHQHLAAKLS